MLYLTDQKLKEYISGVVNPKWHERDFVSVLRERWFPKRQYYVLGVSGLRGMGKTVGVLQALKSYDGAYLCAQREESETGRDYIEILKKCKKDCIVIDEYTWIKEREELDYYLYTLVQNGKRVVITGTETFAIEYLNYGTLIHRMELIHVNLFTYEEYCRLNEIPYGKQSCVEYLKKGGVFEHYQIIDRQSMDSYIRNAVVENLVFYTKMTKPEISTEKAAAIVYTLLYEIICSSDSKDVPVLRENRLRLTEFLEDFKIDPTIHYTRSEFEQVADLLKKIEMLIQIENADRNSSIEYKTYIVNPALSYQLIKAIYKVPEKLIDAQKLGRIYESTCIAYMYTNLADDGICADKMYFIDTSGDANIQKEFEIDFLISTDRGRTVNAFECKLQEETRLKGNASILTREEDILQFFSDTDEFGRYVIYNGKECYRKIGNTELVFSNLYGCAKEYYAYRDHVERLKPAYESEERYRLQNNGRSR